MRVAEAGDGVAPGMNGIWLGILAYRWVVLAWMTAQAAILWTGFRAPELVTVALVGTIVWNVWFTLTKAWERPVERAIDFGLAFALLPISGMVMEEGTAGSGFPFFATAYPAASALTVGAGSGVAAGLGAGAALSAGLVLSRLTNHIAVRDLSSDEWAGIVNGAVYYMAAGGAAGVVSRVLARSEADRARALSEATAAREREARMAERHALSAEIHDSVLHSLAAVVKRGRELASEATIRPADVGALVELAEEQRQELSELIQRPREDPPPGCVSIRTPLHAAAFGMEGLPVSISVAGRCWVPARFVDPVSAAVRQALDNAVRHARAKTLTVFAEERADGVAISVRDDGVGFEYDEGRLAQEGKMGMLGSMKGRVESIGGRMHVETAPGRGTEIEFLVPCEIGRSDG